MNPLDIELLEGGGKRHYWFSVRVRGGGRGGASIKGVYGFNGNTGKGNSSFEDLIVKNDGACETI